MTPQDIVLARFPRAEAQYHDAVYQMGQQAPVQPAYWAIYLASGLGQPVVGQGSTEAQAWEAAAQAVQSGAV
jgi:hypothetical protein